MLFSCRINKYFRANKYKEPCDYNTPEIDLLTDVILHPVAGEAAATPAVAGAVATLVEAAAVVIPVEAAAVLVVGGVPHQVTGPVPDRSAAAVVAAHPESASEALGSSPWLSASARTPGA